MRKKLVKKQCEASDRESSAEEASESSAEEASESSAEGASERAVLSKRVRAR